MCSIRAVLFTVSTTVKYELHIELGRASTCTADVAIVLAYLFILEYELYKLCPRICESGQGPI